MRMYIHVYTYILLLMVVKYFLFIQFYDVASSEEITITNHGKVALEYATLELSDPNRLTPGQVALYPAMVSSLRPVFLVGV